MGGGPWSCSPCVMAFCTENGSDSESDCQAVSAWTDRGMVVIAVNERGLVLMDNR